MVFFAATVIGYLSSLDSLKISPRVPDVSLGGEAYAGIPLSAQPCHQSRPNVLGVKPYVFWLSKLLVWNHLRTLQYLEALPPQGRLALAEVIVP